jgi:DNA topoisomerase III
LKEAKGIGTPATRAEIIKGLKRQNLLTADGKLVVPTPAGLQLFELLKGAAPDLVDPGMTAVWEMRLDEVVTGRVHFKAVIDDIAAEAGKLIDVLRGHTGPLVDLSRPAPTAARRGRGRARTKRNADKAQTDSGSTRLWAKSRRARKAKTVTPTGGASTRATATRSAPPTDRMVAFAEKLAKEKRVDLPAGYAKDFEICRRFLDDLAGRRGAPK